MEIVGNLIETATKMYIKFVYNVQYTPVYNVQISRHKVAHTYIYIYIYIYTERERERT